nr:MarR family transcriptional regulator [Ferranicluibacter rubi]
MIKVVLEGEVNVGALADRAGLSRSATSQHLTKFKVAGLLTQRRDRQSLYYMVTPEWVDFVRQMISIGEEQAIWWAENPIKPRIAIRV